MDARTSPGIRLAALVVAGAVGCAVGCATVRIDPGLYAVRTAVIASVHARRSVAFDDAMQVAPSLDDNALGEEALELELGEIEGRLSEMLGFDVVPVGKAIPTRAYADLPEALPQNAWSQLNDIVPVDVDHPGAAPALGALADALDVDAAIVVRHEWWLARDRFDITEGVTVWDRCTIVVVGRDGRRLWDDTVTARLPVATLLSGSFLVGMELATWPDEARQLARKSGREALDELRRRYAAGRLSAARG